MKRKPESWTCRLCKTYLQKIGYFRERGKAKWNQGGWELINSLGFHFVVGPHVGDNLLPEPAFFFGFLVWFSSIQEKYSELGNTWY